LPVVAIIVDDFGDVSTLFIFLEPVFLCRLQKEKKMGEKGRQITLTRGIRPEIWFGAALPWAAHSRQGIRCAKRKTTGEKSMAYFKDVHRKSRHL